MAQLQQVITTVSHNVNSKTSMSSNAIVVQGTPDNDQNTSDIEIRLDNGKGEGFENGNMQLDPFRIKFMKCIKEIHSRMD